MNKFILISSFLIAIILISCKTPENIVVKTNNNKDSVFIAKKDSLSLIFESNPTTGYKWLLDTNLNTNKIELLSNNYVEPNTNLVGAKGKQVLIFKSKKKGIVNLKFFYARHNSDTLKKKEIVIVIE
ncbi:MAG: protease inhibitor I42 family protein [Bacteroidota bacterium]|nr:protease inhibitor I42 family protein [Bacteroidota bacterium]